MLAKTMELGKRIASDPGSAVLDLHVWGVSNSEPKARTSHPRYHHVFARSRADRPVRAGLGRSDGSPRHRPAVRPDRRIAAATGEAGELLERARILRAVYNERLDADAFIAILDWVHGAMLRPAVKESEALIAMRSWTRDEVARPALRRWFDAGFDPDAIEEMAPLLQASGRRPGAPDLGEPPARRGECQEVRQSRHEPLTCPGGQCRADAGRRQVRVGARLQVLDLRDVVDPPGDPARPRGPVPDDPDPGPYGRDDEPRDARRSRAHGHPGPRPDEPAEISEVLSLDPKTAITPERVEEVRAYGRLPVSLETPVGDESDTELGALIEDKDAIVAPRRGHRPDAPRAGRQGPRQPRGSRAAGHPPAVRARRRSAADARGGRPRVRADPRADPPDRGARAAQAAPPVAKPEAPRVRDR